MARSLKLNRFDIVAVVAVIVTSYLFLQAGLDAAESYTSVNAPPISQAKQMLGLFGWLIDTLGTIGVAVVFWRLAKRLHRAWVLHLLFLPLAFALLWAGSALMAFVTRDADFDHTLGGPVLQAMALFIVAVPAYYGTTLLRILAVRSRPADV